MKKFFTTTFKFNIVLTILLSFLVFNANAQIVNTYTSSTTWVCPPLVTSIKVECWGAGGAGGGATIRRTGGGGGGGGAYGVNNTVSVVPGTTYTITVGTGGIGSTGNGASGGTSIFGSLVSAFGGVGGASPASAGSASAGSGGSGGVGGTTYYIGGNGSNSIYASTTIYASGAGGGGASTTAAGSAGSSTIGGNGGAVGGGNGGNGFASPMLATAGLAGALIGAGGGGGLRDGVGAFKAGGSGANGQVRITYTIPPCAIPLAQPTGLILSPAVSSISGSFIASSSSSGYLVVMTTSSTAPSAPVNGTTYTVGAADLGGTIISTNASTTFNANSLAGITQYWFWVYAYQAPTACTGAITYLTVSPLSNSATTVACGVPTNIALITTYTGTLNWSSLPWSLGHIPTPCENVLVQLDRTAATANEDIGLNLDVDVSIRNFNMINTSNTSKRIVFTTSGSSTFLVTGNAIIECPGGNVGNKFNRCVFSNTKTTTITGNLTLGRVRTSTTLTEGHCGIGSTGDSPNQTFNVGGNMTFNPRGYTTDEWTVFNFDNGGIQYIYNNTRPIFNANPFLSDTIQAVLFEDLRIGTTKATTLIMQGSMFDGYIELQGRAGITIGANSVLDLPANYSLNVISGGSTSFLKMLANSKLRLGGDRSINDIEGFAHGVAGSNFPASFTYNLDPTSTIEYYGNNTITQTIYDGVTYKNLLASNGLPSDMAVPTFAAGTAHAQKITTGPIVSNTSININGFADVTLGTLGSNTFTLQSDGPCNIKTDGGLFCNANVVSGVGAFTMNNFSTLGMGHADGISPLGSASGNIQMTGARAYNTAGNYLYNGIVAQITGTGLPAAAVNDLTIDNPTTVTIANNQLVNGVHLLKQGVFDIQTNKIIINGIGIMNATAGKMKADVGTVEMKGTSGVAQTLSGNWFVNKTINILTNANTIGIKVAPVPADTLLIAEALDYNAVTGSTIITNDNLTLLSRLSKTANFGNATGNSIVGKVNVERYMFARSAWRLLATPIEIGTSPTVSQAWRENNAAHTATGYGTRITGPIGTFGAAGTLDDYTVRPSMKSYNSAINDYTGVVNANTNPIANKNGYYVFVRGDRGAAAVLGLSGITNLRIKGDLRTGDQVFPVLANKFESIGNPFASRIDMRTVNKVNLANTFYVWNPNNAGLYNVGGYEAYLYNAASTNYERVGDGFVRNYIESGEAFFVQSNVTTSGSVTIKETDKGNGSMNVSRQGIVSPTMDILLYAQSANSSMYLTDAVKINFDAAYSNDIDNNDVKKIGNSYDNIGLKNGATNLIVERRGNLQASDTLKFNMTGMRVANYKLNVDPSVLNYPGLEAIFVDKFLQTRTAISFTDVTSIDFKTTTDAASRAADRFMIVFKAAPSVVFTNIAAVRNADKTVTVKWNVDNEVNVEKYELEYSTDGINFNEIATETTITNNGGVANYSKTNNNASIEKNWYRIKANNVFGAPTYSAIALVNEVTKTDINTKAVSTIVLKVNRAGQVSVLLNNYAAGKYILVITNALGQVVKQSKVNINTDKFTCDLKTSALSKGNYQLTVINNNGEKASVAFVVL